MSDAPASPFAPDLFAGQVVFVTGGATGIGKEICRVLGHHGARIAIASRNARAARGGDDGARSRGHRGAVRRRRRPRRRPRCSGSSTGSSSGTANSTSWSTTPPATSPAPMTSISPNGFKAVVDIDLLGTYNVSKAAFDAWLREHGGNIVNITAPFELKGVAMQAHVAAAKAGVDSLTRTVRGGVGPVRHPRQRDRARARSTTPRACAASPTRCRAPRGAAQQPRRPRRPRFRHRLHGHVLLLARGRFVSGQVIAVDGAASVDQLKLKVAAEPV